MHETMIARNLLSAISAEAAKINAKPVAVKVTCGLLYAVNQEVLQFAVESLAKGTVCEGIKITVEQLPLQARCNSCGSTFNPDPDQPGCAICGSQNFELLPDAPIILEEIAFQES